MQSKNKAAIAALRKQIDAVDRRITASLAERWRLVRKLLPLKIPGRITDKARERLVIGNARKNAAAAGLDPKLAEAVFKTIIAGFTTGQKKLSTGAALKTGRRAD
jgi:isochorismate pyruvate lyase